MKSVIAVPFARKLSGRTNYRKRLALLKSGLPRLVVRKTLTMVILQVVDFDAAGDKVRLTITSDMLERLGWKHSYKNIPAAYLAGLLIGKMALAAKIRQAVPDTGVQSITKGGKIFAAIKGAKDAGLELSVANEIVPKADAISGSLIASYAKNAKHGQFSKAGPAAVRIADDFEKLKARIAGGQWVDGIGEKVDRSEKDGRA
ncbi:50S ribosomal protein L18 [Candidatus Woesearchaeota archaeon]|nr:50S ribosomal protein L18 [Candidatus Woesearchaeota archaeon]